MSKRIPNFADLDFCVADKVGVDGLFPIGVIACNYGTVLDRFNGTDAVLDLSQLNSETAYLYLLIDTTQVLDIPIRQPSCQVTGTVQLAFPEGIVDELLRRQLRAVQVASRQSGTGDTQFTGHADATYFRSLKHVNLCVGGWASNGNRTSDRALLVLPAGRLNSAFGWSIFIYITRIVLCLFNNRRDRSRSACRK